MMQFFDPNEGEKQKKYKGCFWTEGTTIVQHLISAGQSIFLGIYF